MATAAFAVAGIAFSLIEQIVLPSLLGEEPDPPGIGSLRPNFADEGAGVAYCLGAHNRVSAQLIYAGDPFSIKKKGNAKRGEATTRTWYADAILAICWNEIASIDRLLFDGNLVYIANPFHSTGAVFGLGVQSSTIYIDATKSVLRWRWDPTYLNASFQKVGAWYLAEWYLTIENARNAQGNPVDPAFASALAQFVPGLTCDVIHTDSGGTALLRRQLDDEIVESRFLDVHGNAHLVVDLYNWWKDDPAIGGVPFNIGMPSTPPTLSALPHPFAPNWPPTLLDTLTIDQPSSLESSKQWQDDVVDETQTQFFLGLNQDNTGALYQSHVGASNAPGLPEIARIDLAGINLSDYGNRLPQVVAFVNEAGGGVGSEATTQEVVEALCRTFAAIPDPSSTRIDASDLVALTCYGITWYGVTPISDALGQLLVAFNVGMQEADDRLVFLRNDNLPDRALNHQHLGYRPFDDPPVPKMAPIQRDGDDEVPWAINVRYLDVAKNLEWGNEIASRDNVLLSSGAKVVRQVKLDVAMDGQQANAVALRILRDALDVRQRVKLSLPPAYLDVQEHDVLYIDASTGGQYQGDDWWIKVERVDIGADFTVEIEGVAKNAAFSAAPSGTSFSRGNGEGDLGDQQLSSVLRGQPWMIAHAFDLAPLRDADANTRGVYVFAGCQTGVRGGVGARLYRDVGGEYFTPMDIVDAGVVGHTVEGYGLLDAPTDTRDDKTELRVRLPWGDLESVTDLQALAGENLAQVGDEVIAFTTAEYLGEGVWSVTGLYRGRMGTEAAVGRHYTQERFCLLDIDTAVFVAIDATDVDTERTFAAAATRRTLETDPPGQFPIRLFGGSARPYPPAHVKVRYQDNGDVTISWQRRTRNKHALFSTIAPPLLERSEAYEVEIALPDGSTDGNILRTLSVTDATTVTYTAAQQSTDGFGGEPMDVRVYQLDDVTGRGRPAERGVLGALILSEQGVALRDENGNLLRTEGLPPVGPTP